jgi:RNA polymerase sigma-70 factor (ECF subfamily)
MIEPPTDVDQRFVEAYQDDWLSVLRFALAWTNDPQAAEDIAQEAFVRLWNRRSKVDWSRPVVPWLLVTARHLATDRFRRLRLATGLKHRAMPRLDEETLVRWLDLRAELGALTAVERTALTMVHVAGFSYEELASVLGTTPGALRAAASRGRTKLETG